MELTLQNGYIYVEQLNYLVFYGDLQFFFYISNNLCVCNGFCLLFSAYFQYICLNKHTVQNWWKENNNNNKIVINIRKILTTIAIGKRKKK